MASSGRLLLLVAVVCILACLCAARGSSSSGGRGGGRGGGARAARTGGGGAYRSFDRYGSRGVSGRRGKHISERRLAGIAVGVIGGIIALLISLFVSLRLYCRRRHSASDSEPSAASSNRAATLENDRGRSTSQGPRSYSKPTNVDSNADNNRFKPPSYESAVNADHSAHTSPTKNRHPYSPSPAPVAGDLSYPAYRAPGYSAEFTSGALPYSANPWDGAGPTSEPQYDSSGYRHRHSYSGGPEPSAAAPIGFESTV